MRRLGGLILLLGVWSGHADANGLNAHLPGDCRDVNATECARAVEEELCEDPLWINWLNKNCPFSCQVERCSQHYHRVLRLRIEEDDGLNGLVISKAGGKPTTPPGGKPTTPPGGKPTTPPATPPGGPPGTPTPPAGGGGTPNPANPTGGDKKKKKKKKKRKQRPCKDRVLAGHEGDCALGRQYGYCRNPQWAPIIRSECRLTCGVCKRKKKKSGSGEDDDDDGSKPATPPAGGKTPPTTPTGGKTPPTTPPGGKTPPAKKGKKP